MDFVKILKAKDSVLTPQQLDLIEKEKLITVSYPKFAGFTLRNVYDFFMMFVVLCGLAGLLLYALSPILKRMMHGIR
jgi:POT family proton-dependent oligopeptide transporter